MRLALLLLLVGVAEATEPHETSTAPQVDDAAASTIAAAVGAAGLNAPAGLEIRFTFRGTPYQLWLDDRRSIYQRQVAGRDGTVRVDRLEGNRFAASIDGRDLPLAPKDEGGLRRSLNSVAYFALLPRPLQDDAVMARSLGRTELAGQAWDTFEVRFEEEGGGDDHDDVFRYWVDPDTHRLGYLAYTFATGKGGVRVRRALRHHEVDGVVLVDWANHGRDGQGLTIDQAVQDLADGTLPQLSTVALEDIEVRRGVSAP